MLKHEGHPAATSILIAEDEGVVALELCQYFRSVGYRVLGPTKNGEDTVALALAELPDIILLDVQLKGDVDGTSAATQIREQLDVPIVFVTAFADEATLARASTSEPDAYVLKPFDTHSLAVTVRMALSRHRASKARSMAEAAQRRAEQHFRVVLDHCHDAVVSVNREGHIVGFNRGAENIFGASASEMLGQPLSQLLPAESVARHEMEFQRFREAGPAARAMGRRREVLGRRKSGALFPAEINISCVKIEDEEVLIACVRDVTERRALEEQFAQAQKMEVVGRLAASVAHDFNNVLTAIQSSAYLLRAGIAPPALEHLDDLCAASDRGAALCRQLLGFSRQDPDRLEVVNTNEVVAGAVPLLRHLMPRNVTLRLELGETVGKIQVDPTLIEQILMNLVTNARDAMPSGGELFIRSDTVVLGSNDVEASPRLGPGAYARIRVCDSGRGVPRDVAERIFEPFFTTKPRGLGTGLGLSTVRLLARICKGDVFLRSHAGRGAIFEVLLPLTELMETQKRLARPSDISPGGNETVLILDGDPGVPPALGRVLGQHGYRPIFAHTPDAALRILRSQQSVDVLLAELGMCRMGLTLEDVEEIAEIHPKLRVIFMRSADESIHYMRAPVLDKPISAAVLLAEVRHRLGGQDEPHASLLDAVGRGYSDVSV